MQSSSTPSLVISDADNEDQSNKERVREDSSALEDDLAQASSKNPSILMELDMDGNITHLSKAWESVVGTSIHKIIKKPISNVIMGTDDDKKVFTDAIQIMMTDDASYRVRFVVAMNDTKPDGDDLDDSVLFEDEVDTETGSLSSLSTNGEMIELEGQGILIHNNLIPTHSMWILKPFNPDSLNVELPIRLAEALGFGADIFSSYLASLSEAGIINEDEVPPPPQVLCRICEQQVPSWWLERHSELCLNEHKCESDVQLFHDSLLEMKSIIQAITESLNKDSQNVPNADPVTDYKGLPLPNVVPVTSESSSTPIRRARSGSIMGNLRFPFKTLALLQELCDTAIQINTSEFDETTNDYEFSPQTKDALNHVTMPNIPASSDPAINLLSKDVEKLISDKVDSVNRLKSSLMYTQKIKTEVDELILVTIGDTLTNIRNQNYSMVQSTSRTTSEGQVTSSRTREPEFKSPNLIQPKPTLSFKSNIFADSYIGTDSLPSPSLSQQDHRSEFSPSRSITPSESLNKDGSDADTVFPKFNDLNIKSPIMTPQRKPSPGVPPTAFHNSPMSSIQRNIKNHGHGHESGSGGTPISSPLILAHDPSDGLEKRGSYPTHEHLLSTGGSSSGSFSKAVPLSPLLVAIQPSPAKSAAPSIKDYEILKPISKGAFGSVYLARRKVTGDYFAIKVLKKSDMIAKNQVTNVKAERAIMMAQSNSPYVARLYSSFQSKDYLFLVMEYLPGGDCSTLVKMLGNLPDEWAKRYIAQVIAGVDDLHKKGIVHHDLKPDNLLIDSSGHLKLTDFGLSRMGLIRRQERLTRGSLVPEEAFIQATTSMNHHRQRKDSISALALSGPPIPSLGENTPSNASSPTSNFFESSIKTHRSDSQESAPVSPFLKPLLKSSSQTSFAMPEEYQTPSPTSATSSAKAFALFDPENTSKNKKFVGTPDYLAPETIAGSGENESSDWWSVGCILFEFLFGYPPFHDTSPDKVFQNILDGKIDWPNLSPEEEASYCTPLAKDLILKLLVLDPDQRLGKNGADEIKSHPYFESLDWETLWETDGSFVPVVEDPESTEYFEARGATMDHDFSVDLSDSDDDLTNKTKSDLPKIKTKGQTNTTTALGSPSTSNSPTQKHLSLALPLHMRERRPSRLNDNTSEFGSFQFRNLPALDKANKDVINRIKAEHLEHRSSISSSSSESGFPRTSARNYSISSASALKRSSSPSASIIRSQSPGRGSFSSGSILNTPTNNYSPHDEYGYFENSGRSSPSTDSGSPYPKAFAKPTTPSQPHRQRSLGSKGNLLQRTLSEFSPSSSDTEDSRNSAIARVRKRRQSSRISEFSGSKVSVLDVLLCEPIPILRFQLKKELEALGCAVVAINAGDELVRRATGQVKFDIVFTALKITKLDVMDIVKLLKHTSSVNSDTPIVAVTAYYKEAYSAGVFSDVLEKPVDRRQLKMMLEKHCGWKYGSHEEAVSDTEALSDADLGRDPVKLKKNSTSTDYSI